MQNCKQAFYSKPPNIWNFRDTKICMLFASPLQYYFTLYFIFNFTELIIEIKISHPIQYLWYHSHKFSKFKPIYKIPPRYKSFYDIFNPSQQSKIINILQPAPLSLVCQNIIHQGHSWPRLFGICAPPPSLTHTHTPFKSSQITFRTIHTRYLLYQPPSFSNGAISCVLEL